MVRQTKVCRPWDSYNIEDSRKDWNDDVMIWVGNAGMLLDQDDHWVNPPQKQVLKSFVFTLVAVV
jgi:hypothetical protein